MNIGTICSGAGIGTLGLGKNIWAVESNPDIATVYSANYPYSKIFCKKVQELQDVTLDVVDCIVATPPCQNASKLTKSIETNADLEIAASTADIVRNIYPSIFVLENVTTYKKFQSFAHIHKTLRNFYNVTVFNADMKNYGFPQSRNRLYMVASKRTLLDMPTKRAHIGWMSALQSCIADMPVVEFRQCQLQFKDSVGLVRRYGVNRDNNRLYLPDEPSFTIRACGDEHWNQSNYINGGECRAVLPKMQLRLFGDVELSDSFILPDYKPLAMTCVGNALSYGMLKLIINSVTGYTV